MQIMRVPGWGLWLYDAAYYGRRWCLNIGPFLIFGGQMTEQEIRDWHEGRFQDARHHSE